MDNIDLSHLLNEVPVPADGAARARQTAARRHRRRQALGGTAAFLLVVGIGTGIVISANRPKEVVLQREAAQTITTTTAPETTTTTNPDPRAAYIGLEHTNFGSGLPVTATIKGRSPTDSNLKLGDKIAYWVRDPQGDMLWVENVTALEHDYAITGQVTHIFDLPQISNAEAVCISDCFRSATHSIDPKLVAIFDGDKAKSAWLLDTKNATFTPTSTKGISLYDDPPVVTPPNPPRPELYGLAAKCSPDDCAWYTANEKVTSNGGASFGSDFINVVHDDKLNQYGVVWQSGSTIRDILVVPYGDGSPLPQIDYSYKGTPQLTTLVVLDGNIIKKAWILDTDSHKFVSVNPVDVTPTKK